MKSAKGVHHVQCSRVANEAIDKDIDLALQSTAKASIEMKSDSGPYMSWKWESEERVRRLQYHLSDLQADQAQKSKLRNTIECYPSRRYKKAESTFTVGSHHRKRSPA
jgi:hypothetical protein